MLEERKIALISLSPYLYTSLLSNSSWSNCNLIPLEVFWITDFSAFLFFLKFFLSLSLNFFLLFFHSLPSIFLYLDVVNQVAMNRGFSLKFKYLQFISLLSPSLSPSLSPLSFSLSLSLSLLTYLVQHYFDYRYNIIYCYYLIIHSH